MLKIKQLDNDKNIEGKKSHFLAFCLGILYLIATSKKTTSLELLKTSPINISLTLLLAALHIFLDTQKENSSETIASLN